MEKDLKAFIRSKLYAQDNVGDMLNVLQSEFDLSKKVNAITQAMIAEQLIKGVEIINPERISND